MPQSSSLFFVIESALGRSPLWKKKSNPTKNLNLVCRCHEKLSKPLFKKCYDSKGEIHPSSRPNSSSTFFIKFNVTDRPYFPSLVWMP